VQARWLTEADLRGHSSHGIQRLPVLVDRLREGLIDGAAQPDLTWRTTTVLVVDGARGFGPVIGELTMKEICSRAVDTGVAVGLVRNANHLGLLAPYVESAARNGFVAIATTTSEALVHPVGGREALIGTNPLAVGVPATPEPFVLDMATAAVSMGRVLRCRQIGEQLQPGWAIDRHGIETLDPTEASALTPFGGGKGYGLALALELVVASLTATALGTDVVGTLDVEAPCTKGDVFIVFDPARCSDSFTPDAISSYLTRIRNSAPAPGESRPAIPGDRARSLRTRRLTQGIPVPRRLWDELMGVEPGLDVDR
jgi:LDH2 family malate/lactate/ureidoglycolate dehydrogenase